jgi:hypothetical protein
VVVVVGQTQIRALKQAKMAAQVLSLLAIPQTLGLLLLAERLRRVVETPFTHLRLLVRS